MKTVKLILLQFIFVEYYTFQVSLKCGTISSTVECFFHNDLLLGSQPIAALRPISELCLAVSTFCVQI